MNLRSLGWCALCAASLATSALADRVITNDNRVLVCKKARVKENGYELVFEHGTSTLADTSNTTPTTPW